MPRRVAFVCNWGNSPQELLSFLAKQTPGNRGAWGDLQGVASLAEAEYLVVLEDLPEALRAVDLDLAHTVFLPREPRAVRRRKDYQSLRAPLAFSHDAIYQAAVWRIMRPFDELASLEYFPKSRPMTTVTSALYRTHGHRMRVDFIRAFVRARPGTLDVYGYGWKDELGASYKGEIGSRFARITDPALCKFEGLRDYRYALAFENCRQANYFTEKLLDAWLAWAMPIYWGCPNLSDYFPAEAYHAIDPARSDCAEHVAEIVARPPSARQIEAIREARNLVLHRYNIWPTIDELIVRGRVPWVPERSLLARVAGFVRGA